MICALILFATLTASEQTLAREQLEKARPALVTAVDVSFDERTIIVKGKAGNPNAVANFVENVKHSPAFATPDVKNIQKVGDEYEFEFQVTLKPRADP